MVWSSSLQVVTHAEKSDNWFKLCSFCCGVDWMRNCRYLLASTHAGAASGSVGMGSHGLPRASQAAVPLCTKAVDVCIFSFMVIERMRGPLEQVQQPLIGAMSFVGHRIAHRRGAHKLVSLPTVMSRVGHTPVSAVFSTNFQNETVSNVTAKGNLW